jgi:hypothetical protein
MLLQLDDMIYLKDTNVFKPLLFHLKNYLQVNSISKLFLDIVADEFTFINNNKSYIQKAIKQYWIDINNIILNCPKTPDNCTIVIYRGYNNKNKNINTYRPVSGTFSKETSDMYSEDQTKIHILGIKSNSNILPINTIDHLPHEQEVLLPKHIIE